MKKIFLIPAAIIAVLVLIAAFKVSGNNGEILSSTKAQRRVTSSEAIMYIVKEQNGKIGVFKYAEDTPMYYLNGVVFETLPQYDQTLLKTGIKVNSEKELQSLIEDYDS